MTSAPRFLRNFVNGEDGEYVDPEGEATSQSVSPVTARVVATGQLGQVEGFLSWLPDHASIVAGGGVVAQHAIVAEMPHSGFKHSGYSKVLSMYGSRTTSESST